MIRAILICFCLMLTSCGLLRQSQAQPKEEFRGVWIATVANIDWPPSGKMPWTHQKEAFIKLLDFYRDLHYNAVIVQIRCAGDAFYPTEKAPWSRYLSGTEGVAPDTPEDPLEWMISQAHLRGMQFHAWLNPYRATMSLDTTSLAQTHDFYKHPGWMLPYGNRYYYNPGLPEVRQHLVEIMQEVVTGYQVDGIHFDDYFYPYKIQGEVFDDSLAFKSYGTEAQTLEAWRRSNVDSLVKTVYHTIKLKKPWVQFGVSPFGVWRNMDKDPEGSDTRAGQTTYDDLHADPLKWMGKGWIDYIVPQVYWSLDFPAASYRKLLAWWSENSPGTNLFIGNAVYKVRNNADKAWAKKKELPRQLTLARQNIKVGGNVLFSAKSLLSHPDIVKTLRKNYYRYPALPPPAASAVMAPMPGLVVPEDAGTFLKLNLKGPVDPAWKYAHFYAAKYQGELDTGNPSQLVQRIYINGRTSITLGKQLLDRRKVMAITFLDAYGRESKPIVVHLNQINGYDPKR